MYVPSSTYRLQLHAGFPFAAAIEVSEYLARLGASACYTSPYFAAMPGSTHGYDVCNHNAINPELGGRDAHREFTGRLAALGLGHVVDFVPNHMGVGTEVNAWWRDVLENGPAAAAAIYFDIDWTPVKAALHSKLLLPILGNQYGRVLERGELSLKFRDGLLVLAYADHELPINPKHLPTVLRRATGPLTEILGADSPQLHEFLSILTSLQNLPDSPGYDVAVATERQREKEVARARLARLVSESPQVGEQIEKAVQEVNGEPGKPGSFDALHELLEAQSYRLSYWRTASHEINYRRFFDVNTLAGLRVEDPQVFDSTHELLGELLAEGSVQGVRIDHPDGLFDPAKYFRMLQDLWRLKTGKDDELYSVAEKILSTGESLPERWAVAGTTGYNYLNDLNGLYINTAESRRMRRVYAKLTGRTEPFADVLYWSKRLIMETGMGSELSVLAHELERIAESNRRSRDFTLESLKDAITSVVACFPVYRTYVDACGWTPEDRAVVEQAIVRARRRNPAMESSLFDFLREVILPRQADASGGDVNGDARFERRDGYPPADADEPARRLHFAMKLQQYTGPVHAKGLEDTAFYRFNLLLSLNEVGGDAERFGRTLEEFHDANTRRLQQRPFEMLATSTHDTKLGEDTRARLNVLSEIPDQWSREVAKWMRINRAHRTIVHGDPAPDRNDEYRFYQALIGIWPPDLPMETALRRGTDAPLVLTELRERMQGYMMKSVKEAKVHTSWLTPYEEYESAVVRFVERTLTGPTSLKFLSAFTPFARRVAQVGMVNSLSQVAVKIGSPGVPDFYQGTELWDLSLVDPDNRRPIDFARRQQALEDVDRALALPSDERSAAIASMMASWPDGRIKLLLTAIGLRLRREQPDLFLAGRYLPLVTDVVVKGALIAFARLLDDRVAIVIAPRLVAPLISNGHAAPLGGEAWKTSRIFLPPELAGLTYRHEITGVEVKPTSAGDGAWLFAGQLFETVPVAVLRAR
jgi:(1->4)-alpha-D-glucan 1-alpha-D-glucosylmutase